MNSLFEFCAHLHIRPSTSRRPPLSFESWIHLCTKYNSIDGGLHSRMLAQQRKFWIQSTFLLVEQTDCFLNNFDTVLIIFYCTRKLWRHTCQICWQGSDGVWGKQTLIVCIERRHTRKSVCCAWCRCLKVISHWSKRKAMQNVSCEKLLAW